MQVISLGCEPAALENNLEMDTQPTSSVYDDAFSQNRWHVEILLFLTFFFPKNAFVVPRGVLKASAAFALLSVHKGFVKFAWNKIYVMNILKFYQMLIIPIKWSLNDAVCHFTD